MIKIILLALIMGLTIFIFFKGMKKGCSSLYYAWTGDRLGE